MVILEVGTGPSKAVFNIHREILCEKIEVLDKMFNGRFQEAITQTATFPEDSPPAFKKMLGWVYRGTLQQEFDTLSLNSDDSVTQLVDLLVLADKYDITNLMNDGMDFLIKYLSEKNLIIGTYFWKEVYERTRCSSKLRLFLTRQALWAMNFNDGEFAANPHSWSLKKINSILSTNEEILTDFLTLMKGQTQRQENPLSASPCDYHLHRDVDICTTGVYSTVSVIDADEER